jgi:hypothetical protein
MLGRVISFGGTAYIINTIALQRTNVLGAIALRRVINLGDTAYGINTMALECTNVLGTIVLERVINWATQPTSPARSSTSRSNAKIDLTQSC